MLFIVLLLLIAVVGVVYVLRSTVGSNPLLITNRMARHGLVAPGQAGVTGVPGGPVVTASRQRREQSAVSQSVERLVGRGRFGTAIYTRLERAAIKMTAGEFISLCFAVFVGAMALGLLFKGMLGLFVGGLVGLIAPWVYLRRRILRRRRKMVEQLADMTQMMSNSLRAGFSILQSIDLVATEGPKPAAEEFERVVTEVKLGLPIERALDHLVERMPAEDIELMVIAIGVQRQIGGNLSEILNIISKTIRERVRFHRDLRTLTAQARYSSYIITALPVAVFIIINFMDQPYESYLYSSLPGNLMLAAGVVMLAMGFFFLNRIANIEV